MNMSGYDPAANLRAMQDHNREAMLEIAQSAYKHRNPVIQVFASLKEYVSDFQDTLDEEHEVGANLVSFGREVTFHVHTLGYSAPAIITFHGALENGNRVQLIQHVSQLSFLLVAVKKLGDKPRRIGFVDTDAEPAE